jgi:hypothetical protein
VLSKAIPKMLADGGQKSPKEELREIIARGDAQDVEVGQGKATGPTGIFQRAE